MSDIPQMRIVIGSASDKQALIESEMAEILDAIGVTWDASVISAHRHTNELDRFMAESVNGIVIAAASKSAALAGDCAARRRTGLVIGVALPSPEFPNGQEAMHSMCFMPGGVPVAFAGVGKHGLKNAALIACQVLALGNNGIRNKLSDWIARNNPEPQIGFARSDKPPNSGG